MKLGPCPCSICGRLLTWNGRRWLPAHLHDTCDAWMPYAKERCARRRGHGYEHKTRWALDNAREAATGRRSAA
jgi:hypothetical protein